MSNFRIETVHGRHLVCGGIIPEDQVLLGQTWASADGSNHTVQVTAAPGERVEYVWQENGEIKGHVKLNFAFQCRYCLVVPTPEVPKELQ